jgi:bacterioferritin
MRGDERVLEFLNEQLTAELTAINQYFLHAKMQENFGWVKIARHTRAESIDEMRHAETLADRILFLDGLPNFQRLFPLRIGQTIGQMLEADLAVETEAVDRLRRGVEYLRGTGDVTSANIFEDILSDEEGHIDYLETQIGLVGQLGEQLYLAQLVEQPSDLHESPVRPARAAPGNPVTYAQPRQAHTQLFGANRR